MESAQPITAETLFQQSIEEALARAQSLPNIDLVVGIPFYSEKNILPDLIRTVDNALGDIHADGQALILSVGDPAAGDWLSSITGLELKLLHDAFLMQPGCNGRGASIRAIMEIADYLKADVMILAADINESDGNKLHPGWIRSILEPLRHNYDLVLTNFERPYWSEVVGSLLAAPLVELFYGCEVARPAQRHLRDLRDLIADYRSEIKFWFENTRGYGIDAWLVTRALRWGRKLCEVELGSRSGRASWAKLDYVFRETAKCLFECIKYDESYWGGGASGARSFVARPDQYLARDTGTPAPGMAGAVFARQEPFSPAELVDQFKRSYHDYQKVYELSMTESILAAAVQTVSHPLESFRFEGSLWANIVYCWLLSYCFNQDLLREDLLNSLAAAFGGRVAGLMGRVQFFRTRAGDVEDINPALLIRSESLLVKLEQAKEFRRFWDDFLEFWQKKSSLGTTHLIPAFSLEFIPGKPIVLPEGIPGPSKVIKTSDTFNRLQQRSQLEFQAFLRQALQIPGDESSAVVIKRMRQFMFSLEEAVEHLFPGDLNTEEGVRRVVDLLFEVLAPDRIFTIKADALREMMIRFPSQDLLIAYGFPNTQELFYSMEIRDAASLSCFMRGLRQTDQAIAWLLSDLSPDAMEETELRPLVLKARILGGFAAPGNISRLDKLAARVLVRPLAKGMGGEYPKLRFCLYIARQMGVAENFSLLWRGYARERRDLGIKLQNSLAGSYESRPFSAHNILENLHHRLLVGHLLALAERQNPALDPGDARLIRHMVDGYGLGQVLYDGAFLSCSAWTWSSYSYKGGRGLPTPLSSRVEEQWFAYELLKEIYQELGYDPGEIWKRVAQLIGEGRGGVGHDRSPHRQERQRRIGRYPGVARLSPGKNAP